MDTVDVIVVGAGPAGEVCAGELGEAGLEVALIERELLGGECSYYSCMPSKALLRPDELRLEVTRVPGVAPPSQDGIDADRVLKRRDEVIGGLSDEKHLPWLEARGVRTIRGDATITGEREVEVEGTALAARLALVIATGSQAAMPPVEGLDRVGAWTNRTATTVSEVPDRLIVLGGGPVGSELAQAWASLGSEVTLIEAAERLLSAEEPFASEEVEKGLKETGVEVLTGTQADAVSRDANGQLEATLDDGRIVRGSEILVAVGRRPNIDGLGLEAIGLDGDDYIEVDDQMRIGGRDGLFAIGDVNGRSLLTHVGKYQAQVATKTILGSDAAAWSVAMGPPRVTFTDPQLAAAGLTEASARERGLDVTIAEVTTSATAGASFYGRNTEGSSRLVMDRERGVLVGATFVGFETAEMIHAATVAIVGEVPVETLRHAMPSFPTRNEIWLELLDRLG